MKANNDYRISEEEAMKILNCNSSDLERFWEEGLIRLHHDKKTGERFFFKTELLRDINRSRRRYYKKQSKINRYLSEISCMTDMFARVDYHSLIGEDMKDK